MAWRMKLKLPKFKVTLIGEKNTHRSVPRGRNEGDSHLTTEDLSPSHSDERPDFYLEPSLPESVDDNQTGAGVSLHAIKQKAVTSAWDQVRTTLRRAAVENSAMPTDQCCIMCSEPATHRCTHCGAWAYYCANCFGSAHSTTNFFHVGEVWKVKRQYWL